MAWFRKPKQPLKSKDKRDLPPDVFEKCQGCGEILYRERLAQNHKVCPECGHHFRIPPATYLGLLLDAGTFVEHHGEIRSGDPLGFEDGTLFDVKLQESSQGIGVALGFGHVRRTDTRPK